MARARPECNGGNTRCSSAADRIIVPFLHGTCPVESFPLYSPPPPFLPPFFLTPPFHYRGNFSRFPIRFPRYTSEIFYTHTHIYVYISVFKTGKWQNSGNSGATSVFCKISRGTKLSGMAITGSPGREIRRIPSTLRAPSRDEILRATYVFVTYVGWPRGPPMLDGETKRIIPEGSEAPKPASFRFPFPYYPASRLLFTNSLSVFIEGPRPLPVISNLLQNAWHFFEGKTEKGKGRRSVIRRVKDRSRGIGIGLERGSLA